MVEDRIVLSTFQFSPASQEELREAARMDVLCVTRDEDFINNLKRAEIVCSYRMPENWHELAPHLRWLQYPGAGVDALLPTGLLAADSGVIVTTASGIHATTISEYVFGSMLMFNWNWPEMVRLQESHVWAHSASWYHLGGRELEGQTLGVIGLGHIGRRVAVLGRAFGMRVLGMRHSAHQGEEDRDVDQLFAPEQLHEMLPLCDYIVLAVPLTSQTEGMIGEAELRLMKPNAYLVNVARGRVVDEVALTRALQERRIAGAGLDVTEPEPLPPESPLYTMQNVILTPHISGVSLYYDQRLTALFANNLRRYRAGQPLLNRYDPARGY
ncbi:MAG TPA: D-2-hydroxyacid dehydrogenase [Ktedonobacteraceae bacterium]|nr:D-2-hydroxyacid dehydrogenase [Ktedonobacteraceae bacterium]